MGLNSFLKAFLPKDKIFYNLFEKIGTNLTEMSKAFTAAMNEPDFEKRVAAMKLMEDWEHTNDNLTHKVFIELGQNFITPFDREDIHYLATALDDVADYIYACASKIVIYNVDTPTQFMKDMTVIVENSVTELVKAVNELRNMKNIREITEACVKVNSLENQADELYSLGMHTIFSSDMNAIDVIKYKDIYQDLETITDKCEDATNIIESIIVKYA